MASSRSSPSSSGALHTGALPPPGPRAFGTTYGKGGTSRFTSPLPFGSAYRHSEQGETGVIKSPASGLFQFEIVLQDGRRFKSALYTNLKLCEKDYSREKKRLSNLLQHRTWDKPNGDRTEKN